jgi:hypothetical protein
LQIFWSRVKNSFFGNSNFLLLSRQNKSKEEQQLQTRCCCSFNLELVVRRLCYALLFLGRDFLRSQGGQGLFEVMVRQVLAVTFRKKHV